MEVIWDVLERGDTHVQTAWLAKDDFVEKSVLSLYMVHQCDYSCVLYSKQNIIKRTAGVDMNLSLHLAVIPEDVDATAAGADRKNLSPFLVE